MAPPRSSLKPVQRLLLFLFIVSVIYQAGFTAGEFHRLRDSQNIVRDPVTLGFRLEAVSGLQPEAEAAGIKLYDVMKRVDGQPFNADVQIENALEKRRPGDLLRFDLARPNGREYTAIVKLAPVRDQPASLKAWLVESVIEFVLPIFCLALGFYVAAARPDDVAAWMLLGLMIGFSQIVEGFLWVWPLEEAAVTWHFILGTPYGAWLVFLVGFAIVFPERAEFERKRKWLKWVLLGPLVYQTLFFFVFSEGLGYDIAAIRFMKPALEFQIRVPVYVILSMVAVGSFFTFIGFKIRSASNSDARRRLRIIYWGTSVSLTPTFIVSLIALKHQSDIFFDMPEWVVITSLLFLLVFPITLAYVIVVQRAMQVRMVVRQGLQYALAKRGLNIVRASILATAIIMLVQTINDPKSRNVDRVRAAALVGVAMVLRRRFSEPVQLWIDKRFFREAYSTEQVLGELSMDARNFTDARQLIDTVAHRMSDTLHISRITVFVREDDRFCIAEAIGGDPHSGYCLPVQALTVKLLNEARKPELVYFDDPRSWVHGAALEEQTKLRGLDAEVLLALPGRERLLGLMALGPKLSEEPYSTSDLALLQSVASQTGLALENAQLLKEVAREAASRERLNREVEIAREVQERFFPQSYQPVPGIDYFGLCRPALAVGGDYYDFLPRPNGIMGIALGDISGKGISASLMMASLHALMRGQLVAGMTDLATLISNTNRLIYEASTSNRYATFFYGEYDPASRKMTYVNAGHNAPIILRGAEALRLEACGPVIGLLRDVRYESAEFQFQQHDVFITYTDGISEAMTIEDEEWGEDRLIEAARACCARSAREMTSSLMGAADAFAAGAPQHDDMTLIVMKVQ
jgi:sigma-B regulation protein RsbU (phosphoserine phosphatase)